MATEKSACQRVAIVTIGCVFAAWAIASGIAGALSALVIDAPGAMDAPLTWNFALSLLASPIIFALTFRLYLDALKTNKGKRAMRWAWLQAIGPVWFVVAATLNQICCGGSFVCRH